MKKSDDPMFRPRETTLGKPWRPLLRALGGNAQLAEELGISTMTLWRWGANNGAIPIPAQKLIRMVAERHGVSSPL